MKTKKGSDDLKKITDETSIDINSRLKEYENSKVEWKRELFDIVKKLFEESIQKVLLAGTNTKIFEPDTLLYLIFRQILVEAQHRLEHNDKFLFEYHFKYDKQSNHIVGQLIPIKRTIILKKKEANEFVHWLLMVPALLVRYNQSNYSSWLREYSDISREVTFLNRVLEIAQTKIKKQQREKKELTFDSAIKLFPEFKKSVFSNGEKCRDNNGKINSSKLGRMFGVDHKTAKRWCQKLEIPLKRPSIN